MCGFLFLSSFYLQASFVLDGIPAVSTSEHLDDTLAKNILGGKAQPVNPHAQRLLAASKKPVQTSLKNKDSGGKGTAAKSKGKPKKRPSSQVAPKAKAAKTTPEVESKGSSKAMSSKEITSYYSGTKKWFMEKWGFSVSCSLRVLFVKLSYHFLVFIS